MAFNRRIIHGEPLHKVKVFCRGLKNLRLASPRIDALLRRPLFAVVDEEWT